MINLSSNQALQRWDTLPQVLRDALYSEPNSEFVWKTADAEHIPEQKIYGVLRVAGYVLMGFIHPEDMAAELKDRLNVDPKVCASIAEAINQRIFTPIRQDIDKIYEPPSKFGAGPKMIQDLAGPEIISQTAKEGPSIGATPIGENQMKAAPAPAAPAKLPDVGWSRSTPAEPVVKLSETRPGMPQAPARGGSPAPGATTVGPKPAMPAGPMGEFERISLMQQKPPAPAAPGAPMPTTAAVKMPAGSAAKAAEPAPVMLHEDASYQATPKAPEFRIQMPTARFGEENKNVPPVKPAMMELGKAALPAAGSPTSAPAKVVHYTEYKPAAPSAPGAANISAAPKPSMPVPPVSMAPQGPRQVTELTSGGAPSSKPSAPPAAPASMPKPPTPPTPPVNTQTPAPAQKIVYKNYSEPPAAPMPPKPPTPPGTTPPAASPPAPPKP